MSDGDVDISRRGPQLSLTTNSRIIVAEGNEVGGVTNTVLDNYEFESDQWHSFELHVDLVEHDYDLFVRATDSERQLIGGDIGFRSAGQASLNRIGFAHFANAPIEVSSTNVYFDNLEATTPPNMYDVLGLARGGIEPEPEDSLTAQPFRTRSYAGIDSVAVSLERTDLGQTGPSGEIEFSIWDDDGTGTPGKMIASLGGLETSEMTLGIDVYRLDSEQPIVGLENDSTYFLLSDLAGVTFEAGELGSGIVVPPEGTSGAGGLFVPSPEWTQLSQLVGAPSLHLDMAVIAVPEPSSIGLLACGRQRGGVFSSEWFYIHFRVCHLFNAK